MSPPYLMDWGRDRECLVHGVSPFGDLRVNAFSSSPKLFAGFRVLHRLLMPRHPPAALISLTNIFASILQASIILVNLLILDVSLLNRIVEVLAVIGRRCACNLGLAQPG